MEKQIRFRLFHYFVEDIIAGTGEPGLIEKTAHFGDIVDIPRDQDIRRGEAMGAFFSDDEMKAIKQGEYDDLPEGAALAVKLTAGGGSGFPGVPAFSAAELPAGATTGDLRSMTAEQLHDYIQENKVSAKDTVALAQGDPEMAEKLLDAESMNPEGARKTVISGLEAIPTTGSEPLQGKGSTGTTEGDDSPPLNASKDEWQNYAGLKGVEFDEDDTRDDLIAKVQKATAG